MSSNPDQQKPQEGEQSNSPAEPNTSATTSGNTDETRKKKEYPVHKFDYQFLMVLKSLSRMLIFEDEEFDKYVGAIEEAEKSGSEIPIHEKYLYLEFGKPVLDTVVGDNLIVGLLSHGVVVNVLPRGLYFHPMMPPIRRAVYVAYPRFHNDKPVVKPVVFGYLPIPTGAKFS